MLGLPTVYCLVDEVQGLFFLGFVGLKKCLNLPLGPCWREKKESWFFVKKIVKVHMGCLAKILCFSGMSKKKNEMSIFVSRTAQLRHIPVDKIG